jgi:hypothetical protein
MLARANSRRGTLNERPADNTIARLRTEVGPDRSGSLDDAAVGKASPFPLFEQLP